MPQPRVGQGDGQTRAAELAHGASGGGARLVQQAGTEQDLAPVALQVGARNVAGPERLGGPIEQRQRTGHVAGAARNPAEVVQRVGAAELLPEIVEQPGRALQVGAGAVQVAEEGAVDATVVERTRPPRRVGAQAGEAAV